MLVEKGFQIEPRVSIAIDALSSSQKAAIKPILRNKECFVARAKRRGAVKKLSASKPLYSMRARAGLRIIFTVQEEMIVVQDIMQKTTMDRFLTRRGSKALGSKEIQVKVSPKKDEAFKLY